MTEETNWQESLISRCHTVLPNDIWFETGPGWRDLLTELCTKLQIAADKNDSGLEDFYAVQIKQKFGGLRFYTSTSGNDETIKLIQEAEGKAIGTCEICGDPGKINGRGWIMILCNPCKNKKEQPADPED